MTTLEPPANGDTIQITRDDFERWLALQTAIGWRVTNPEVITQIRKDFNHGATFAPFRQIHPIKP